MATMPKIVFKNIKKIDKINNINIAREILHSGLSIHQIGAYVII